MNPRGRRRGAVAVSAALALAPLLASCAEASYDKQVERPHRPTDGYNRSLNKMRIRNMFVLGPKPGEHLRVGESVPMYFSLRNDRARTDTLLSITTPVAKSVTIKGGPIKVAPGEFVKVGGPKPVVVLHGLTQRLKPDVLVPVTFHFRDAGVDTFRIPLKAYARHFTTYSPVPEATKKPKTPRPTTTEPTASPNQQANPPASKSPEVHGSASPAAHTAGATAHP